MAYRLRRKEDHSEEKYIVTVYKTGGIKTEEFQDVYKALDHLHYVVEYEIAKGKAVGAYIGLKSRNEP